MSGTEPNRWYSRVQTLQPKARVWLFGIVAAVATSVATAFLTGSINNTASWAQQRLSAAACHLTAPQPVERPELSVSISPFYGDSDGSQTRRVRNAFLGAGFSVVEICETLAFDDSKELRTSESNLRKVGESIIKKERSDLLIFGEVVKLNESVQVWFVNAYGGCDPKPTNLVLTEGLVPDSLSAITSKKLITSYLMELTAACDHPESVEWGSYASKVRKLESFLPYAKSELEFADFDQVLSAYSDALDLLYKYQGGEEWFDKDTSVLLEKIAALPESQDKILTQYKALNWSALADIRSSKWKKTRTDADGKLYLKALNEEIQLDPSNVNYLEDRILYYFSSNQEKEALVDLNAVLKVNPTSILAHHRRGVAYMDLNNYDEALKDFDAELAAIDGISKGGPDDRSDDGKTPEAESHIYNYRAQIYKKQGNIERALQEYDLGIKKYPNEPAVYNFRCWGRAIQGQMLEGALEDCNEALRLIPSEKAELHAATLDSRGLVFLKLGRLDLAIADYDATLKVNPESAESLMGRSVAFRLKGEQAKADADLATATKIDPGIRSAFQKYGFLIPDAEASVGP